MAGDGGPMMRDAPDGAAAVVDAAIVGAGPAGAATAVRLRALGLTVALLDKEQFPRHKICGDFLPPGAVANVRSLCGEVVEAAAPARLTGLRITWRGRSILADFPPDTAGWGLSRLQLDALLVKRAVAAGADLVERFRVERTVRLEDGRHRVEGSHPDGTRRAFVASLVVEAGGRFGLVGRRLGWRRDDVRLQRWALWSPLSGVEGLSARCEMHVIDGGYVGVAPLPGEKTANVTMVLSPRRMAAARSDPRGYYRHVLGEHAELGPRLDAAHSVAPVRGLGPLACRARRFSEEGIALVGDACGFVDPFTAEGVSRALESARMLGDAVAPHTAAGRPLPASLTLPSYESAWRERFGPKLALCRMLQVVIARPWLAGPMARGLSRRKDLANLMIAATGDLLPAASVMNPSYVGRLLIAGAIG